MKDRMRPIRAPALRLRAGRGMLWLGVLAALAGPGTSWSEASSTVEPARVDRLGAVGIGVSDLQRSIAFYEAVLGLEVLRTYELGYIEEVVLGFPGGDGAVIVLMHWPGQDRPYEGNDVKLVFYVDDPAGVIRRIHERGGVVDREAAPHEAVDGAIVGLGRDPDNYVVEVLER